MFQDTTKQTFLFKCQDCQMIISVDLKEPQDVQQAQDGEMVPSCPCSGQCKILRN